MTKYCPYIKYRGKCCADGFPASSTSFKLYSSSVKQNSSSVQVSFKFYSNSLRIGISRPSSAHRAAPAGSAPLRSPAALRCRRVPRVRFAVPSLWPGRRSVGPRLVRGLKAAYKPSKVCRAHSRPSPARLSPSRPWPSGPLRSARRASAASLACCVRSAPCAAAPPCRGAARPVARAACRPRGAGRAARCGGLARPVPPPAPGQPLRLCCAPARSSPSLRCAVAAGGVRCAPASFLAVAALPPPGGSSRRAPRCAGRGRGAVVARCCVPPRPAALRALPSLLRRPALCGGFAAALLRAAPGDLWGFSCAATRAARAALRPSNRYKKSGVSPTPD